jgi:hypothetical protein
MLRHLLAAAIVVATPASRAVAQERALNASEQASLRQSLDRGTALYRYDQSAWHVTDAALAALPDASKQLIRGYVTTPAPQGPRTTFFGSTGDNFFALYSAVWTGSAIADAKLYAPEKRVPVSNEELRLIEARKIALQAAQSLEMCSKAPANMIVVPDNADETVHAYVLTPQTKMDTYPFGGHHRIDVKDGKIIGTRAFTKSCIDLALPQGKDSTPVALMVTHLLDPLPTEIHVFNAFAIGLPIMVATPSGRLFEIAIVDGQAKARVIERAKSTADSH